MLNNKHLMARWVAALFPLLLVGCGGGAAGAKGSSSGESGIPSGASANATLGFDLYPWGTDSFLATQKAVYLGSAAYAADSTGAAGLTGQGVWIGIVDDFQTQKELVYQFPAVMRTKTARVTNSGDGSTGTTTSTSTVTCAMTHQWKTTWTHGDLVTQIAGGTRPAEVKTVALSVPVSTANPTCASTFYGNALGAQVAQLTIQPILGVAFGASIQRYPVELGTAVADPAGQLATVLGHLKNALEDPSRAIRVINMSFGADIGVSAGSRQEILDAAMRDLRIESTIDAVLTVAAGNDGKPCTQSTLYGCNLVAVAMASQDITKGSTIVVGALTGSGSKASQAIYSNSPGYLADRFLWALGDADEVPSVYFSQRMGTSFAAPRVAGAAALLRQKYPHLTSVQIADLLLDSADRDMDNDGRPDFTGTSLNWGRGKLSLSNALKLAAERYK